MFFECYEDNLDVESNDISASNKKVNKLDSVVCCGIQSKHTVHQSIDVDILGDITNVPITIL